ncbi:MAG: hypothetical protein NVS1B14_06470 [Vulcanimicrobiaceae bacterium]
MLHVVDRANRIGLGVCGIGICAGAVFLAPLAAAPPVESDSCDVAVREFEAPVPMRSPSSTIPGLARDPFAPLPRPSQTPASGPNATASNAPSMRAPAAVHILAVITGERNRALVVEEGRSRIVSPGDEVGGTHVMAIDAEAMTLADGSVLHLSDPLR